MKADPLQDPIAVAEELIALTTTLATERRLETLLGAVVSSARRLLAGDLAEAKEIAERAAARDAALPEPHGLLGLIALAGGDLPRAEGHLRYALDLGSQDLAVLRGLSTCCLGSGDFAEALVLAERARLIAPLDVETLEHLARCQAECRRFEEAEATCRSVLAFAPNRAGLQGLLARVQIAGGKPEAALAAMTRFARANPRSRDALVALAETAREAGRLAQVLPLLDQALFLEPEHGPTRAFRDEVALALGRCPPRIAGGVPAGARIFVPASMLAGEFVLLGRFLVALAGEGGTVPLFAPQRVLPLAAHLPVTFDVAPPSADEIAWPLMDLMRCFAWDDERVPWGRPYLRADPVRQARWRAALEEHPRPWIGVIWDGDAPGLSMESIRAALPAGATPVSLMTGDGRHALSQWPEAIDAGAHVAGISDLIAAIANLDGVIGPDVAALHIAGALGRPGTVGVDIRQPWGWASRDDRSLWYPTLRVVRQSRVGLWEDVVAGIHASLAAAPAE